MIDIRVFSEMRVLGMVKNVFEDFGVLGGVRGRCWYFLLLKWFNGVCEVVEIF